MLIDGLPETVDNVVEGKRIVLQAAVLDDVQVRNVEFFVDGEHIVADGGYPYETDLRIPIGRTGEIIEITATAPPRGPGWLPKRGRSDAEADSITDGAVSRIGCAVRRHWFGHLRLPTTRCVPGGDVHSADRVHSQTRWRRPLWVTGIHLAPLARCGATSS